MRIQVITLFPDEFRPLVSLGVTGRALTAGKVRLELLNPRDFARDRHRTVDDRPYGGGPGMVMAVEPLRSAIRAARERAARDQAVSDRVAVEPRVSLLSPQGKLLDQAAVRSGRLTGNRMFFLLNNNSSICDTGHGQAIWNKWPDIYTGFTMMHGVNAIMAALVVEAEVAKQRRLAREQAVRKAAVETLARQSGKKAVPALKHAYTDDASRQVSQAAYKALIMIEGY